MTCSIFATNELFADGDGALSVHASGPGECPSARMAMTVSYIDTTGTPVTFDVGAFDGFIGARAHNVGSALKVRYSASLDLFCDCSSSTFSLPK